jgi:sec-independent protein translocase protein TatA
MPGGAEWIVIVAFGLLIFGKKLPEVGRSLGRGIVEFKKGLKGVEDEVEAAADAPPTSAQHKFDPYTGQPKASLPPGSKFDPYTGKPLDQAADAAGGSADSVKTG